MIVLNITRGQDTGGQMWRTYVAFRRLAPDWTVRSITRPNAFTYIQYPEDLLWMDAKTWWRKADVVHLHNNFEVARTFDRNSDPKPAVIHYHGTSFRANPTAVLPEQRRRHAIGLASTLDLWLMAPNDLEWLPAPYDLDWLASLKEDHEAPQVQADRRPAAAK